METCLNRLVEHPIVTQFSSAAVETIEYNSFDLRLTSFEAFLFGRLLLAINTSQYIFEVSSKFDSSHLSFQAQRILKQEGFNGTIVLDTLQSSAVISDVILNMKTISQSSSSNF
ncbi:hypothetical protein T08_4112 [Trichinella sp. T8]|nr:hypothetical protein T08_4112 [Trichinella sp. T8]